jgi:putative beta-lysine N-acetyltransferase
MKDVVERICGADVQHGVFNNRVYVMRLTPQRCAQLVDALDDLAHRRRYGKILAKIPARCRSVFADRGYVREAAIPGFFVGSEDAWFVAKYPSPQRAVDPGAAARQAQLRALDRAPVPACQKNPHAQSVSPCGPEDAPAMARLFSRVFASYPFPIQDPDFLRRQMTAGVYYAGIRRRHRWAALAAAETDHHVGVSEMTDFATLKTCRGRGMAGCLLRHLDTVAAAANIETGYTIARAGSPGMNRAFHRSGYRYGGYLPNNTHIGGRIESMSVWYKPLTPSA